MISFAFHKWSSSFVILAASSSLWMAHQRSHLALQYKTLQKSMDWVSTATKAHAREAFDAGEFREAAALLEPASLGGEDDKDLQYLQARSLECVGRFKEAAEAYARASAQPGAPLLAERSRTFCLRMASERSHSISPSREALYRLHEELMRRRQCAAARHIAQQLLPDLEPLRVSAMALLRNEDERALVELSPQAGHLNVTISAATKPIVDLLRDLPIESLSVTSAGLQDSTLLSGLQVHALNLNFNPLSDIAALRSMPLRQLNLSNTHVADIRVLAGTPLRDLNLSHTCVTFLRPLSICPIERLNLAGLAIHDIRDLGGLALRQLDLSHTQVCDLSPLASMPLEDLRLDGCMVRDLRPLAGSQIKRLSLAHTPITDLSPLSGLPLVDLDLRGCELLSDLDPLTGCLHLEKLHLPRHLSAPPTFAGLPRLRFIDHDQVWTAQTIYHTQTSQQLGAR